MRWKTREDGSVAVSLLLEWNAIASVSPSEMSPLHPLEIPLVVFSSSTISEPDSRNTRERASERGKSKSRSSFFLRRERGMPASEFGPFAGSN